MKILFSFLLLFLLKTTSSYGQGITYDDFKKVIPYLQTDDFKAAFEKTEVLLDMSQNDSSDLRGIVMYMNILSAAGMVSLDKMSYEDFSKNTSKYVGQWIVMPAHPCIDSSSNGYNSLQFISQDGKLEGMTISANISRTNILCFEYFNYSAPINPPNFIGKSVRCGGVLKEIEVNPNKSKIWISRLHVSDAFIRVITPQ